MREICDVCGEGFEKEPLFCKGRHQRCYHRVWRAERQEKEIRKIAQRIADEVAGRYGVTLTVDEVGNPAECMSLVEWCLESLDAAFAKMLPEKPLDILIEARNVEGQTTEKGNPERRTIPELDAVPESIAR